MKRHPLAGRHVPRDLLVDVDLRLVEPAAERRASITAGQDRLTATMHLSAINQVEGSKPWKLRYSYGRALQDEALNVLARTAGVPRRCTARLQSSDEVRQRGCPRQIHDLPGNRIGPSREFVAAFG